MSADSAEQKTTERVASTSQDGNEEEVALELQTVAVTDTNDNEEKNTNDDVPKDDMTTIDEQNDDKKEDKNDDTTKDDAEDGEHGIIDDLQDKIEEIRNSKYTKSECICFFTFLIVFTTMVILGRGIGDVSFTQTVTMRNSLINKDEFVGWNGVGEKNFDDASTIEDIYRYLESVAFPFLLNEDDDYYIQSQQALLGGLRFKQLRYDTMECDKKKFERCWDSSDYYNGDVDYYYSNGSFAETFSYFDSSKIDDQSWRGKYGSYSGGGYLWDFPMSLIDALEQINYLRDIEWIDGGTRFVCLDFNTFNPSTSLHTVARIAWEMPTAGVFANDEIKTWKFERYVGTDGKALAVFHVLFVLWVIGMTIMMAREMFIHGCLKCGGSSYWNSKWKAIDAANLLIFYITIILFIYNETYRTSSDVDLFSRNKYSSFRKIQYGFTLESYTKAVNGGLLWIKLFKYLAINKRLKFLFTMLGRSGADILMFIIVLSVFVIAFGTAGFITFNSDVDDFRSYMFAMSNMIRFVLVEMDYTALTISSRIWGSAFYFFWSLLMLLVLVNVFIAILTESYSQVQMELTDDDKLGLTFVSSAFKSLKGAITSRINASVRQEEFDADGDGKVSAQELADQTNISIEEAKEIIAKHDVDGDGQLDAEEFEQLKQEIIAKQLEAEKEELKQQLSINANDGMAVPNISTEEFNKLKNEMNDIKELLTAVLDQTPAGKKALRQREIEKNGGSSMNLHKRRRSTLNKK